MPLNFKFPETIDKALIEYQTKRDGDETPQTYWHPRAESLVWFTMLLKHRLDGDMTNKALAEIDRRIRLIDLHHNQPAYWEGKNGYRIQLADIVTYWGLDTNVEHLSAAQWNSYYNKCFRDRIDRTTTDMLRSIERTVHTTRPLD
jgi:hypothetical protein